jgi:hypothetical protein
LASGADEATIGCSRRGAPWQEKSVVRVEGRPWHEKRAVPPGGRRPCRARGPPGGRTLVARDFSPWMRAPYSLFRPEGGRVHAILAPPACNRHRPADQHQQTHDCKTPRRNGGDAASGRNNALVRNAGAERQPRDLSQGAGFDQDPAADPGVMHEKLGRWTCVRHAYARPSARSNPLRVQLATSCNGCDRNLRPARSRHARSGVNRPERSCRPREM